MKSLPEQHAAVQNFLSKLLWKNKLTKNPEDQVKVILIHALRLHFHDFWLTLKKEFYTRIKRWSWQNELKLAAEICLQTCSVFISVEHHASCLCRYFNSFFFLFEMLIHNTDDTPAPRDTLRVDDWPKEVPSEAPGKVPGEVPDEVPAEVPGI